MANALAKAPSIKNVKEFIEVDGIKVIEGSTEHSYLIQEYDPKKRYVFELAAKNLDLGLPVINMRTNRAEPHKEYKPFQNLVFTSQIVWNNGRVGIRYYDGCESIFISQQPKEKDVIDQLIKQTRRRNFIDGKLVVDGYERMLLMYLNLCSWNADSPFRTQTANEIFIPKNADKIATEETKRMDTIEEALQLAKDATDTKMYIHADYLGIPLKDYDSQNDLSTKEVRALYRKRALQDADNFIESYGNKSLEIKYYINKALMEKVISNRLNPNKAIWDKSGNEICDISGLKSNEAISERLFEYSQVEEGEEFLVQLKAIYNK